MEEVVGTETEPDGAVLLVMDEFEVTPEHDDDVEDAAKV